MGKEYKYDIEILEHHLDTFGHVNNATYMELYEQARWDLLTQCGYGIKEILTRKIGPVILEANIKYNKELRNRDTITIFTTLDVTKSPLISLITQKMIRGDGEVASEATFTCGLLDLDKRKLLKPTLEWLRILNS